MKLLWQQDTPVITIHELKSWEHDALIIPLHLRDKHRIQPDENFYVFTGNVAERFGMQTIQTRKDGLMKVDSLFRTGVVNETVVKNIYSFVVYMERESGEESGNIILYNAFNNLKKATGIYCFNNDGLAVIVPHFHQEGLLPHIHFLYQRNSSVSNELQKSFQLNELMNKD